MSDIKIAEVLQGNPCALTNTEIMEIGAKCSSQGYTLERQMQVAKTLFKNDSQSCFKFLEYVEKNQMTRNIYNNIVHQQWKSQIYYSLAALSIGKAVKQNDKHNSEKLQKQFNKYLNAATKSPTQKLYQLLHGFNSYYVGDFSKAISNFNNFEQKDSQYFTIAQIGLAQSYFMLKKYESALQYYKKALISNKHLPAKARLGMAYCFFQLQKYQLAQKCFQRILSIDPKSHQSYMGLAAISYRKGEMHSYFKNLKSSYALQPNDPLVVLHLSEHFLFMSEYDKCKKMSIKGLQLIQTAPKFLKKDILHRDDYEQFKARFNNLIGQVHHTQNQFEQARKYYELANNRGLRYNSIALAQTLMQANMIKQSLKIYEHYFTTSKPTQLRLIADSYRTIAYLQVKAQVKPTSEEHSPNNYYKQALKYNKHDYETLIDYSVYLSDTNDKKQTLKILQNALKTVQATNKQIKPQLLNNIGVYLIQQRHYREANKILQRALLIIEQSHRNTADQQLRHHSLYLTISFNLAVTYQLQHKFSEAIAKHKKILAFNKYYVDSYVRLADVLHQLGERQKALETLQNAITQCSKIKINQIRIDRLLAFKAHLYHVDGSNGQAKQCFKRLGNFKFQYEQFYEMCLGYESVIKKQFDKVVIKDFLRPNRQTCIKICNVEPTNAHSFMVLIVLFITDNKISKQQAVQYFNQLKIAQQQFPQILYNFGIFSMLNEDYENALFCLHRYKQKTKSNKADQFIALIYLLKGDFLQSMATIKKNILNEPNNLKYRYQYAYTKQKRVQKLYQQQKNFKDLKSSSKYLTVCKRTYQSLSKISTNDYLRAVQNPDMKQRLRNDIVKLRQACDYRDKYVQSQFTYYSKKQKQIEEKQQKIRQDAMRKLQQIKRAKQNKKILQQMGEDDDQSQSQKLRRQRRRKLAQLSLQQSQRANQQWRIAQQQEKLFEGQQGKKKRRTGQSRKQKKQAVKQQKQQQSEYQSEAQFKQNVEQDQDSFGYDQGEDQDREGKKKKKKKKNKNKDREGSQDEKERKRKKKKKKQRKQRQSNQEVKNEQMDDQGSVKNQQGQNSQEESNPFDDNDDKEKQDQQLLEREKPQKKKRRNDEDDQDGIDINAFLI